MGRSDCTQQAIDRWVAKVGDPVRSRLMRFRAAMDDDGCQSSTVRAWLSQARLFLWYLAARKKDPEKAQPSDVRAFKAAMWARARKPRSAGAPDGFWNNIHVPARRGATTKEREGGAIRIYVAA